MSENRRPSIFLLSLPALILSAACLLPYLNKAFTIDDPVFMLLAQQIRKQPLRPMALDICWGLDNYCRPVAQSMPGNFLVSYFLAPVANAANPERLVHLIQIILLWCGIVATVSLACGFGLDSFAACVAGLVVASTPPVLAMASTAMPEMLAMALAVIGIERLWAWRREGRAINGVVSSLALGLAPIARVHLFLLWPIAGLLLRDDARFLDLKGWVDLPKRRWSPLIGAAIVSVIILVLTHEPSTALKPPGMYLRPEYANRNVVSYLSDLIVAMPVGLAWLVLRNRLIRPWLYAAGLGFPVLRKLLTHFPIRWTTLTMGLGAIVLIDILLWSFRSRDRRRIACALWLLLPLVAIPYVHLPVKYLVPCAPAAALLMADVLREFRWPKAALAGIVAIGTIVGSMVLFSDNQFAEMGRQAAERLIAPRVEAGQRVWFASQWGFYWYALKAGGQVLRTGDVPVPGDYLVRGELEGWPTTMKRLPPAVLVDTYTVSGPSGRTMSLDDGAGLYSNLYGDLMWSWGAGEWNHYEVWEFQ
jgi:hypothetical protein